VKVFHVRHILQSLWLSLGIVAVPASADHLLWKYNFSLGDKITIFAGQFVIVVVFTFGLSRLSALEARQPWRVMHELRNLLTVIEGRILTGNIQGAREALRSVKMLLEDRV
jgi:hypothetical protein